MTENGLTESEEITDDETGEQDRSSGNLVKKGKLSKKMMIIIAGSVSSVFILVIGGIIAWKSLSGKSDEKQTEKKDLKKATVVFEHDPALDNMFSLEPFKLPLRDEMGDWELRVAIELEAAAPSVKQEIGNRQEEIREVFGSILQSRRPSALQGVDSKIALRTELIMALNKMLKKGKIKNLYFTQFVVI
ncbi:MAG: flagellar basal body-associated FliL family protein [Proteobacteria bacterium]|nr:flagellar basal body-associated FliL family protein [Pseudomonadota bacterium]